MRRTARWLVLSVVVGVLAACGGGDDGGTGASGGGGQTIPAAAVFDLSGATADVGTPYAEGVRGYVDWRNANGGIEGRRIDLQWADYAYDVAKAEQLYSQFLAKKPVAFLGWGTGDTEALRTRVTADRIPFMSGSYSAQLADPKEAPYNFVVAPTYSRQMQLALDQIAKEANNKGTVAAFHNDSPFGQSPLADGKKYIDEKQLGLGYRTYAMPRGATSFDGQLSQAKAAGATYGVIQNVSSPSALLAKNIKEQNLDMKLSCLNWCADEQFVSLAGGAAEGSVGVAPFAPPAVNPPGMAEPRRFLESKGESLDKKGVHYVQGWYTMALMAKGIENAIKAGSNLDGPAIKKALEDMAPFDTGGVTSPIEFSADNHEGMKTSPLYRVKAGKWAPLQ